MLLFPTDVDNTADWTKSAGSPDPNSGQESVQMDTTTPAEETEPTNAEAGPATEEAMEVESSNTQDVSEATTAQTSGEMIRS